MHFSIVFVSKMSHATYCVVNCKNTGRNSNCKFYCFPTAKHKLPQREKWIAAVRRINRRRPQWYPKPSDKICCEHFVGNKKADEQCSPNYFPTIFLSKEKTKVGDETAAIKRHERFMKRRNYKELITNKKTKILEVLPVLEDTYTMNVCERIQTNSEATHIDQECQVETSLNSDGVSRTFTCNRYICNSEFSDLEIQTDIIENTGIIKIPNNKKFKDKGCNTPQKTFVNNAVGSDFENDKCSTIRNFCGIDCIKNNEQMLGLAGVTLDNFELLLTVINSDISEKCTVSKKNRLLIFLIKMKTGLTFSAISVIFSMHRTTISKIFFSVLEDLAHNTRDLVFWPDKDVVRATTPECFHPKYSNTRVIIDCTEFKIEVPTKVDDRIYTYSHYKKGFTAKLLLGITPSGFICFKSKVAGGRKSDSQITIESGLLDKLEDGDIILADKGFPQIQAKIDNAGKKS